MPGAMYKWKERKKEKMSDAYSWQKNMCALLVPRDIEQRLQREFPSLGISNALIFYSLSIARAARETNKKLNQLLCTSRNNNWKLTRSLLSRSRSVLSEIFVATFLFLFQIKRTEFGGEFVRILYPKEYCLCLRYVCSARATRKEREGGRKVMRMSRAMRCRDFSTISRLFIINSKGN